MDKLTVVMYHYVRDLKHSRYPSIKGLDVALFKEQIDYLDTHYKFVTIPEVIAAFEHGNPLPPKAILLTFDDAYIDHYLHVFPILQEKKIQGVFFPPAKAVLEHDILDVNKIHFILAAESRTEMLLEEIKFMLEEFREEYSLDTYDVYYNKLARNNRFDSGDIIFIKRLLQAELEESLRGIITDRLFTKFVSSDKKAFSRELYMNVEQLRCMQDCGMYIGSHGYNHYWLNTLSREMQEDEIKRSKEFIRQIGGDINNWVMGFPYGAYNEDTLSLLKEHNCKLGFTTVVDVAKIDTNNRSGRYTIPRLDTNDLPKERHAELNKWYDLG